MDLRPGTRFGPYEIVSRLGAGGMGVVYRARDTRLGRDVAVKVLKTEFANDTDRLRRFEQEARATSALNHPNILSVFDVGTWEGSPYIVSELLEGSTLRERLHAGTLTGRKALDFADQIARALAAAHQKGIIHRDLKPENLFLTRDGRAKILDFGLAKLNEPKTDLDQPPGSKVSDTQTGRILGSAGYMSPEQVRGQPADQRSDIFSLGAVLYEMVSGNRPFRGPSQVETMNAILTAEPPPLDLPDVPPGLETIISHCLEKDPADRFQTAQDLAFNLESIRDSSSVTGPRTARKKTGTPSKRTIFLVAGFCVALLAALALAMRIGRHTGQPPPPTYTRLTFRQGNISEARFAPDGKTVVYSAAWDGKPIDVFTTRVDSPESRRLGLPTDTGIFSVSSQGVLAIAEGCELNEGKCHGTLAQVSLTGGAPRKIAEDVDWADWAPGGNDLAIVRAVEGRYRLEYPIGHVLYSTTGWISNPRVSPDGQSVAFADHPDLAHPAASVAVVDRSGKKTTLSEGWRIVFGLAWRNNDEIWFNGSRTTRTVQLFRVKLDKSERFITSTAGTFEIADISREGNALFFRTNIRTRMSAGTGTGERELSWFDWSTAADIAKDGKTILFYEWGDGTAGAPEVYIRSTDGSDATRLGSGKALALSPDGKWALALESSPKQRLVMLPTGAGEMRILPPGDVTEFYSATFFPDGQRILIAGEGSGHVPRSYVQETGDGRMRVLGTQGMAAARFAGWKTNCRVWRGRKVLSASRGRRRTGTGQRNRGRRSSDAMVGRRPRDLCPRSR